jgi:hypothetical protein
MAGMAGLDEAALRAFRVATVEEAPRSLLDRAKIEGIAL